jgi:hypothetical protein
MAHYYLYLLDQEQHIKAREILSAGTETEAVAKAEAYLREHTAIPGVELWLGERLIKTLQQAAAA